MIKFKDILTESQGNLDKAMSEIKNKATGSYRYRGLIFGSNGMAEIYISDDSIYIGSLISFNIGGGKRIMSDIINICNIYKANIKLLAQAYDKNSDNQYKEMGIDDNRPKLSQSELISWYKRIGFTIIEKNKNSAKMIKYPDIK